MERRGPGCQHADLAHRQVQGYRECVIYLFFAIFISPGSCVYLVCGVDFEQVTHWPKDDYGKFYDGDSYILLNTYKEKDGNASV